MTEKIRIIIDSCVFLDVFDEQSKNHKDSFELLQYLDDNKIPISMPAHAWFEIQCTFKKLVEEKRFKGPLINGKMAYVIELIDINQAFINKYSWLDIPYIKAGDHIFIAIAKKENYPLVTSDTKMMQVCKKCGVKAYSPSEYLNKIGLGLKCGQLSNQAAVKGFGFRLRGRAGKSI